MTAEEILDRFTDEDVQELERYYLGTISGTVVCHNPLAVARLLLRLSVQERSCLAGWACANFDGLPAVARRAA